MIRVDFEVARTTAAGDSRGYGQAEKSATRQFVVLVPGARAQIAVTEHVPVPEIFFNYLAEERPEFRERLVYRDLGTAFEVAASLEGMKIRLELTPVLRFLNGTVADQVQMVRYKTVVLLDPGQEIILGGGQIDSDFYRSFYESSGRTRFLIKVRPSFYEFGG